MVEAGGKVLVTGGSGYLGGWCVVRLLESGYDVRTTIRDLGREGEVRANVATQVDAGDRLEVVAADLTSDDGWADAVTGCEHVLHVASPFPTTQPKDPDELIVPARDGALRVIDAALAAGAKRIVMTSSVAAVRNSDDRGSGHVFTEDDWTDGDNTALTPYTRSKTIAEQAAWERVREAGAEDRLATINPGAIIGPVLGRDRSFSLQAIERLLNGMPAVPQLGFSFVDVRDTADLHLLAMTSPAAGGRRFIATTDWRWFIDVARVLRERLGEDRASKVPTRVAPNILIRLMSLFDGSVRSFVGDLGVKSEFSNEAARSIGWSPRPVDDSVVECAESLLANPA
jgi:nucleoside-diphosphate-sugar epimerase